MKAFLFVVISLFSQSLSASATSEEFVRCNKIAVSKLEYCLADGGEGCWTQSKTSYHDCRERVTQQHLLDPKRIDAEKSARQKIHNKSKQEN